MRNESKYTHVTLPTGERHILIDSDLHGRFRVILTPEQAAKIPLWSSWHIVSPDPSSGRHWYVMGRPFADDRMKRTGLHQFLGVKRSAFHVIREAAPIALQMKEQPNLTVKRAKLEYEKAEKALTEAVTVRENALAVYQNITRIKAA